MFEMWISSQVDSEKFHSIRPKLIVGEIQENEGFVVHEPIHEPTHALLSQLPLLDMED
jgi:hypothetical protein